MMVSVVVVAMMMSMVVAAMMVSVAVAAMVVVAVHRAAFTHAKAGNSLSPLPSAKSTQPAYTERWWLRQATSLVLLEKYPMRRKKYAT